MAATNKRASSSVSHSSLRKDHVYSASSYALGATPAERFVFDNEKWAHSIELETFGLRSTAVTQGEFAAFVNDRGYQRREWWSQAGWRWKQSVGAEHPIYWRRDGDRWQRRVFDRWLALQEHAAMVHVNAYEAEAWCAWADRRLPTEAEWERAAGGLEKQRYPWSEDLQEATDLRMDWCDLDCGEVDDDSSAHESDRPLHLLGNVWEWTASDFRPFPGFIADPYADYSQPWFRGHRVLRGGSWATRSRMIRNTLRNFYTPDRRDAFAGFRTCPR